MKGVPNTGIPQWLPRRSPLLEYESFGRCRVVWRPGPVTRRQVSNPKGSSASIGLRPVKFLPPEALFNLNGIRIEVHVFPFEAEDLGNSCAGGDAGLDDQPIRLLQVRENLSGLIKTQNSALILILF